MPPTTRLKRQTSQGRYSFKGSATLVSGIVSKSLVREEMLKQSRILLESMKKIAPVYRACKRYEIVLGREALRVHEEREERKIANKRNVELKQPNTAEEVLLGALQMKGVEASIEYRESSNSGTYYHVEVNGMHKVIPIRDEYLQATDPTMEVSRLLDHMQIGKEEEKVTQRISTIPAIAVGIDREELEKRMITYDGKQFGKREFTYGGKGLETTVYISDNLEGRELLREIDEKIFEIHMKFNCPFNAGILEVQAGIMKTVPVIKGLPDEVKDIATALHNLISDERVTWNLVPYEYRKAYERLKKCAPYNEIQRMKISSDDVRVLEEAFSHLDHPTHAAIREMNHQATRNGRELNEIERQNIRDMLEISAGLSSKVPVPALRNLEGALAMVSKRETKWSDEEIGKKHFEVVFLLRKKIMKVASFGAIEI